MHIYVSMHVYASIQETSIHVCKYASMQTGKHASVQLCKYAHICKYAGM